MRRILPIVLVLTALLPSLASAAVLSRCPTGAARGHCCCGAAKPARERDPGEAIRRSRCCQVGERELATAGGDAIRAPDGPPDSVPTVAVAIGEPAAARAVAVAPSREVAQSRGPPESLWARRCALLL